MYLYHYYFVCDKLYTITYLKYINIRKSEGGERENEYTYKYIVIEYKNRIRDWKYIDVLHKISIYLVFICLWYFYDTHTHLHV